MNKIKKFLKIRNNGNNRDNNLIKFIKLYKHNWILFYDAAIYVILITIKLLSNFLNQ